MKTAKQINLPQTGTVKVPSVQEFAAALQRGESAIREAAAILCQMVDADPKAYQKIHKETGIHWNVLGNLERVGRGAMHYKLLFDTSPAARHISALPASQQNDIYEKGVQVVSVQGGKTVVESKKPHELTPQQVRVLFDDKAKHVRSVDEQLKVASEPKPVTPARSAQRYIIANDKLTVLAATTFTMSQLQDILEDMKQRAIKSLAK